MSHINPAKIHQLWDDLAPSGMANRMDVSRGHLDYNYSELTIDFDDTSDYPDDPLCYNYQMRHRKEFGGIIRPHVHWLQKSATLPNWMIRWRWVDNGQAEGAWTNVAADASPIFTYSSGTLCQISTFGDITPTSNENVSSILQVQFFRDTTNASTLFSGADTLVGDAQIIVFDIHYSLDSEGSFSEYSKWD